MNHGRCVYSLLRLSIVFFVMINLKEVSFCSTIILILYYDNYLYNVDADSDHSQKQETKSPSKEFSTEDTSCNTDEFSGINQSLGTGVG